MLKKWVLSLLLSTTFSTSISLYSFEYQKWYIMGGKDVQVNKYRWFATIRDSNELVNSLPIGVGALIAPEWVLTAGHLFQSSWTQNYEPRLKVTFNQTNLDNLEELTTVDVAKVIRPADANQAWVMGRPIIILIHFLRYFKK